MAMQPEEISVDDTRLIEAGFPCHQVGAETQRERGASSALPPLYFLHVWWARRPLTPSRAAILGSLLPADTDPEWFLRELGIEKVQAMVGDVPWTLTGKLLDRIRMHESGYEYLLVDDVVVRELEKEQIARAEQREVITELEGTQPGLSQHRAIMKWREWTESLPTPFPDKGQILRCRRVAADPAGFNVLLQLASELGMRVPNLYGYSRAYLKNPGHIRESESVTILDPTAGGGSIPFEALRLGHKVIANDLNPVAAVILHATLDYPARYGSSLVSDIRTWGERLLNEVEDRVSPFFPSVFRLSDSERKVLDQHLKHHSELTSAYDREDVTTYLFVRQVTCPHCEGEAPLLNTSWLSKTGEKWGVRVVTDGRARGGKVSFQTYRIQGSRGPNGEDPNFATVSRGVGRCVHCRQAISADEIKAQARGESPYGKWKDRLYCVVAERLQPKLDKDGRLRTYKSGARKGEIVTEKVRFFRPPNETDLTALEEAEEELNKRWPEWERQGLIPTERIPEGNDMRPVTYGMDRWCDMFTPRQLLGHLTMIETLNRLKPEILRTHGEERGRAIVTYLQFAIDKGLDYNSRQTRWEYTRGVVKGTFGRHDFSLKWTFGEMIFSGPNSGAAWGLSQVVDAYVGIASLVKPIHETLAGGPPPVEIRSGSAASTGLADKAVDLICFDPPYYNNVQYAELSDYFYVWQRRTLADLYPGVFNRVLTNKQDEAVANPARDGSTRESMRRYEEMMKEIFAECARVLKDDGVMTMMFTHRTQEAWEALTRSLIESGWTITSTMPVESEAASSTHQMDKAAAASSIFITCRKRTSSDGLAATWTGFGGTGVAQRVREAVRQGLRDFERLELNPVDEMVASYGRALQVLSENWPVYDGDDIVSPRRAMIEASHVVAQYQLERITEGRLHVTDLSSEAAVCVTLLGIFGLGEIPYDEALTLSRSLNIRLEDKAGGYEVVDGVVGINPSNRGRADRQRQSGYRAPLTKQGSKLRLALPEERHEERVAKPQTEWDVLHGVLRGYRQGDIPVARAYLQQHAAGREHVILDLLTVWASQVPSEDLRKEANAILFGLK